jgi:ditrans,polycis-polyprenyl diphosphate synthase
MIARTMMRTLLSSLLEHLLLFILSILSFASSRRVAGEGEKSIPKHIAFIMDGNRRWEEQHQEEEEEDDDDETKRMHDNTSRNAQKNNSSASGGHQKGALTLQNVLRWSLKLRQIETISVYAFSIENFNREKKEVDELMSLCVDELPKLARSEAVRKANARILISGRMDLLSKEVREACAYAMEETKRGGDVVLNICLAYSGAEEFGVATFREAVEGRDEGGRSKEEGIKRRFYYGGSSSDRSGRESSSSRNNRSSGDGRSSRKNASRTKKARSSKEKEEESFLEEAVIPDVDLVVRTSGTNRLSDFMTTRLENALIVFVEALWPDFGVLDFFSVIWRYRKASSILRDNEKKRARLEERSFT